MATRPHPRPLTCHRQRISIPSGRTEPPVSLRIASLHHIDKFWKSAMEIQHKQVSFRLCPAWYADTSDSDRVCVLLHSGAFRSRRRYIIVDQIFYNFSTGAWMQVNRREAACLKDLEADWCLSALRCRLVKAKWTCFAESHRTLPKGALNSSFDILRLDNSGSKANSVPTVWLQLSNSKYVR